MSPRCDTAKVRISSLFSLPLRHENPMHCSWQSLAGIGHSGHLPATTAHHALPVANSRPLLPRLAPPVQLAAEAEAARSLYPQFPRAQGHTAPCKDNLRRTDVAHHPLLRLVPTTHALAQSLTSFACYRHQLAYTFV